MPQAVTKIAGQAPSGLPQPFQSNGQQTPAVSSVPRGPETDPEI